MNIVEPIRKKKDLKRIESILRKQSLRDLLLFTVGTNCGLRISDILAKDTFQRPPATRWTGIFQNFFCLSNPGNRILATGGAENFSFHSLQHRVLKFAKWGRQLFSGFTYLLRVTLRFCQMDNKKAANLFQTYCFRWPPVGGGYSVLKVRVRVARQTGILHKLKF